MVDAKQLLADLKRLRRTLEADLREQHQASAQRDAAETEWREAFEAKRTADTFETFWTAALDQAAVHWILGVVFLRFLEDNGLLDRPFLSGPGERLELAAERQRAYVRLRPMDTDTDYLLDTFGEAARLPGLAGLYDPTHNPLFRLPLSGDGAIALLASVRARVPETGALVHDFSDPAWNTRFLGDLYQELSDDARKRFALLQTPEFVEEWILSRTLDPAMREFGATQVRMIDPTCGSGHFLLGGFARVLAAWQAEAPDMPPAARAQRALESVSGVDVNPFAVEIARFRLLLAALQTAGETRLAGAPDFKFSLAVGDSLLHGRHFGRQRDFAQDLDEGFQRRLLHHYATEDTAALDAVLGRQYHAVVGNPPYITPKDPAMRDAYREIYGSCYRSYALSVPFTERFFDLALAAVHGPEQQAGFIGLIVANSFMRREFGAKLIEEVLPQLDLTHVIDCSGAFIPGHATPTVILFGRNRIPVAAVVRTVMGIRGEPSPPQNPEIGLVWSSIVAQADLPNSESEFVSVADVDRSMLSLHPWSIGGGGASDLKLLIERAAASRIGDVATEIGFGAVTREDDAYLMPSSAARRNGVAPEFVKPMVEGEYVRDYQINPCLSALWPYEATTLRAKNSPPVERLLWPLRQSLQSRVAYGQSQLERGLEWFEYSMFFRNRFLKPLSIVIAFVATHNHFVLDRGGNVFKQSAPVIKLPVGADEDDHIGLVGLLNTSTACFWCRQVMTDKGNGGIGGGISNEIWERRMEVNGTNVDRFPITERKPLSLAKALDVAAQRLSANLPAAVCGRTVPTRDILDAAHATVASVRGTMIALQEELDWCSYGLYGLLDDIVEYRDPPELNLGERAFEIVMARSMAEGTLETAWFSRHGSIPITEIPSHWPSDYRDIVQSRIDAIETRPTIGLIERPEHKRRWSLEPWENLERDALRNWLLERLEFPHYWSTVDPRLTSCRALADFARHDADFLSVAALYTARDDFDLDALVADLVAKDSVPFLPILRYSETGQRKHADWEATWKKQRAEDAIDANLASQRDAYLRAAWARANARADDETADAYAARMAAGLTDPAIGQAADHAIANEAKRRKLAEVGTIPVPSKYRTPDFLSTDFWRLRGGLDVPKERFVSFPHCARDADGSLPVLWAGYDHLTRAKAIAAWFVDRKDTDGWAAPRLIPLLAGLLELAPWLLQWHNDVDPETGIHMGDYFADFVEDEARSLGLTLAELRAWTPPAPVRRPRGRRAAA